MRNRTAQETKTTGSSDTIELLQELEQSTPDAVKRMRTHDRLLVRTKVVVRPGNQSQRKASAVSGVTGDISAGGCQLLLPEPLLLGDIYWMEFDRASLDVSPVFARCLRCRLVREDAYEAGLMFFTKIELPKAAPAAEPNGVGHGRAESRSLI